MNQQIIILLLLCCFINSKGIAQVDQNKINPKIINSTWDAQWITHPTASKVAFGVYHFRNSFELKEKPEEFIVHVSADNRYELYVNGQLITLGPAWSDLLHWRFESVDIAKYLHAGKNVLAAQVVNFGDERAVSQFSYKTGFLMQGNSEAERMVNTNPDNWKVIKNEAYRPIHIDWRVFPYYYATFSCDTFDVAFHVHNWQSSIQEDDYWLKPSGIGYNRRGTPRGGGHYFQDQSGWLLVPRPFPLLESTSQRFAEVERSVGITVPSNWIFGEEEITIPAQSKVNILLDQGNHTRAYPELLFSQGKGSTIKIEYAEALVNENREKGNRNITQGKNTLGYYDIVLPDGGEGRKYRPLWVRVFRFLSLQIETGDQPLILHDIFSHYTAYPYDLKASWSSDDQQLEEIVNVSWRTLRNATAEVFEDGPYYEQIMYAGDARIASLVSLYLSGDERMTKNAIQLFYQSIMPEGLTYSRYPSNQVQINPQYSLAWIQMIHDYFMHGADPFFVKKYLRGIEGVLSWHANLIDSTGMLAEVPFLRHIEAKSGTPKHPEIGHSAQQTLFFAFTLSKTAELFEYFEYQKKALEYRTLAQNLNQSTLHLCYDADKELLADTPKKLVYTQHANVLAILTEMFDQKKSKQLMQKILKDESLLPSYLFFKFYLFQALEKAGMANELINQLEPWRELLDHGLTTFPEFDIESRSDCHPWSTHPAYFLFSTVAGIKPAAPGFKKVKIEPHFKQLNKIVAVMPHPQGLIKVEANGHQISIILPENIRGTFVWRDKILKITGGKNSFDIER